MEEFGYKQQEKIVFRDKLEESIMLPAYEKALDILKKESLQPEMFADTYNQDMLERHAAYVKDREQIFAENRINNESWARAEVFGKTLEGILHNQINEGIFGDDVRGVSTTKYDDYHAGVDEVIERYGQDGSTYIGCAIDVTFGNPRNKIQRIFEEINVGRLKDVTYYESPFGDPPHIHGSLRGIPKVIIGMDEQNLIKLSSQWIENDQEELNQNHLFLNFLRQIQMQAEVYREVAKRAGQNEVSQRYDKVYSAISKLYSDQKSARGVSFLDTSVTDDRVNISIREEMDRLINLK